MAQTYPISYWHIINDTIAFNDSVTGLLPKQTVTKYKDMDPVEFYRRFVFPKIAKIKQFTVEQLPVLGARFIVIYSYQTDELLTNTKFTYTGNDNKQYQLKLPNNKDVYIFPISEDSVITINGNGANTLINKSNKVPQQSLNIDTSMPQEDESSEEEDSSCDEEESSGEEEEEELGEDEEEELGEEEEEELGEEEEEELGEEEEELGDEEEAELGEEDEEECEDDEGGRSGRKKKAQKKATTESAPRGRKKNKCEPIFNISQMLKHESWSDANPLPIYTVKYRQEVIRLLTQFCKLPVIDCYKIEFSIYNYAITQAEKYYIYAHWENPEFIPYYVDKAKSLICNLCADFGVNNTRLKKLVSEHKVDLLTLANMSYQELWPENWQAIKDERIKLEQMRKDAIKAMATDIFKCPRCKKKNSIYFELQTRSSDEPMTQFITCQECGLQWKQG